VQAADKYKIDPVHSFAMFRVHHMNTGFVYGRVTGPNGEIMVDDSDATQDSFNVTLDVKNIDTGNAKRDEHLKSPDFFSAEEFPQMTFKSTAVKANGDDKLDVTGDLTIHGQTKPITITITKTGASDTKMMGKRVGFESTFTIKRSDFGMSKMLDMVSDEVNLTVAFEAAKE
jgi:polyisoprenoid-binding protein YceI